MSEFVIPSDKKELLNNVSPQQYRVAKLVDYHSLQEHLNVYFETMKKDGPTSICKMFDYPFSVAYHWNKIDSKLRDKTWESLVEACRKMVPLIMTTINSYEDGLPSKLQLTYRTSLKMIIYLISFYLDLYQTSIDDGATIPEKTKGRKKPQVAKNITCLHWNTEISDALNNIYQLIGKCPIEKFWSTPNLEEDFVNLIGDICYKQLGHQENIKVATIKTPTTDILVKLNKSFNHTNNSVVKLVNILSSSSNFHSHLVSICSKMLEENLCITVRELLREICSWGSVDLERSSQTAGSFTSFLIEFGAKHASEIVPIMPQMSNKLKDEPYSMRNAVLSCISEVIVQVYPKDESKRNDLLDELEEHLCDVNAFVRSKALSALHNVVLKETILSIQRKNQLMRLMIGPLGSMNDTSAIARKNAIKIMTSLVQQNIAKGMTLPDLQEHIDTTTSALKEVQEKYNAMEGCDDIDLIKSQIDQLKMQIENEGVLDPNAMCTEPLESIEGQRKEMEKLVEMKRASLILIEQSFKYVENLSIALEEISMKINSKTVSDVLEAVVFLREAKLSGLPNVDIAIRKMLPHICSSEVQVQAAVAEAYRILYLSVDESAMLPNSTQPYDVTDQVVDKLSGLVPQATYGEIVSLEMLVKYFIEKSEVDKTVVENIWQRVINDQAHPLPPGNNPNNTSPAMIKKYVNKRRLSAVVLFSMMTKSFQTYMKPYYNYFVNDNLNYDWLKQQPLEIVFYLCTSIRNLIDQNKPKNVPPFRLPKTHGLFEKLYALCVENYTNINETNYIRTMFGIVDTIYMLSENPEWIVSKLICQVSKMTFKSGEPVKDEDQESSNNVVTSTNSTLLARFVALGGHAALKHFVHLEVAIGNELKRRNAEMEIRKDSLLKKKYEEKHRKSKNKTDLNSSDNLDEEMGLTGATADDAESEHIRKICELELVSDKSLMFSRVLQLILYICRDAKFQKNEHLQAQASLALSKIMTVSSRECRNHIELLIRIAARSPSETIRANLIVSLGDLMRRFTTDLEPYTPLLYGRLRDSSARVRKSALNVISHLVLNDMIRVKGQISEMTICLVDSEHPEIVHLAKVFFQELANKDKALYNVIPDIISRLSSKQTGVDEEQFRTIMGYLMPFIQKKNLSENLFDKICARFNSTDDERTWRDLSFCLSLIPCNENILKIIEFNMDSFAGKLHVNEVYEALFQLLNNAKKITKPGIDAAIDELLAKLNELRDKGVEDEEAIINAQRAAHRKSIGGSAKSKSTLRNKSKLSSQRTASGLSPQQQPKTAAKKTHKKSKVLINTTTGEENLFSSDEEMSNGPNQSIRSLRPKKRNHIIDDSSDEEN